MPFKGNKKRTATYSRRLRKNSLQFTFSGIAFGLAASLCADRTDANQDESVSAEVARLCDRAATEASRTHGVPLDVLRTISRAETGRNKDGILQPWPWAVNMEGSGQWFSTLDGARSYVFSHFKNGARSFDVGCFQINYKWHGRAFRSIDDMFDPFLNAQYAAKFLAVLYQEFGDWPKAAGAYHSRTVEFAKIYSARFDQIRENLPREAGITLPLRTNYPLALLSAVRDLNTDFEPKPLVSGGTVTLGSLVPIMRQHDASPRPFVVLK